MSVPISRALLLPIAFAWGCATVEAPPPTQLAEVRPGYVPGYLKPEQLPDAIRLVPPPPAAGSNHRLGVSQVALPPRFCPVAMLFPVGFPSASQYRFAACATRAKPGATDTTAAVRTQNRQVRNRRRSDRGTRTLRPGSIPEVKFQAPTNSQVAKKKGAKSGARASAAAAAPPPCRPAAISAVQMPMYTTSHGSLQGTTQHPATGPQRLVIIQQIAVLLALLVK